MTLGDPSNIPACYPSGRSTFSPGLMCPSGWHASSTSTISYTSYLAMCCPSATLAESIGVVWMPSTPDCSYNLSQNLVTHGWLIQPDSTYSIYEGLTMGHLEANRVLLQWRDADLSLTSSNPTSTASPPSQGSEPTTPLSPTATAVTTETSAGARGGGALSSAQKTSIGVLVPVVFFISVVAVIWLILRHRRLQQGSRQWSPTVRQLPLYAEPLELLVEYDTMHELHPNDVEISELGVPPGQAPMRGPRR